MKRVIRTMQGTGFLLFMLGSAAFNPEEWTSTFPILTGLGLMIGFLKLENSFYFGERKEREE